MELLLRLIKTLVIVTLVVPLHAFAAEGPQTITLDGRLYDSNSLQNPLLDTGAVLTISILDPSKACVLYEEQQTVNTAIKNGFFNVQVGSTPGDLKRTLQDPANLMPLVFQNSASIPATNSGCAGYTPQPGDVRAIRIKVTTSANVTETLSPDMTLDSVPTAMVAETVQGLPRSQILALGAGQLTQANVENVFSTLNYPKLTDLLSGNSSQYMTAGTGTGAKLPNYTSAAPPASPANGSIWYDSTSNTLKFYNGSVQTLGTAGAGISSLSTTSDLTAGGSAGGTLSGPGTIGLANTGVIAGDYAKVRVDGKGRVTQGLMLATTDIPTLTTAGSVSGSAITSGTIGGSVSINTSGNIAVQNVSTNGLAARSIDLTDSGAHKLSLTVPVLAADYSLVFPGGHGSNGQVLTSDGVGNLIWSTPVASTGGTVTSVGLAVPSYMTSSGGPVTSNGTLTLGFGTQTAATVFAGPSSGTAAPSFRTLAITDLKSTTGGNFLAATGACSAGQTLAYSSVTDKLDCAATALSSSQVTTALGYAPVNKAGDTMTATLNLPVDGLNVGTTQLAMSSGNVGIGTATPGAKLDVNGIVKATGFSAMSSGIVSNGTIGANAWHASAYASNSASVTTPETSYSQLQVTNPNTADGRVALVELIPNNSSAIAQNAYIGAYSTSGAGSYAPTMVFGSRSGLTSYQERMRIDSSGNVGIGTANPNYLLDVAGSLRSTGVIRAQNGNGTGAFYLGADVNALTLSNNVRKVGRIVAPTYDNTSANVLVFAADNDGTDNGVFYGGYPGSSTVTSATKLHFLTSPALNTNGGTERMVIDGAGNVGIGTTVPTTKLEIDGTSGTTLKIVDGNQAAGKVLTSDANGIASWAAAASSGTITALTGDVTASGAGSVAATVAKVNGVTYPATPTTNTVPVVTGANTVTYQTVPNAALTNSSVTIGSTTVSLGATTSIINGLSSVGLGVNATTTGQLALANGNASGTAVTLQNNAATTAYNFNLPATAGTSGYALTSAGGGTSPMTWTQIPSSSGSASITTLGTVTTGTWNSTTIGVPFGGTGTTTLANHGVLLGQATSAVTSTIGGVGTVMQGNGVTADPTFTATPVFGVNTTSTGSIGLANGAASGTTTTIKPSASATTAYNLTLPANGGTNGYFLQTDGSGTTSWAAPTGSGTVNSGTANQLAYYSGSGSSVSGLSTANNSVLTTNGSGVPSWSPLATDAFAQYALLAGRASGQILKGGTAASENLTLDSTAHATKGYVLLAPSGGSVGIGTTSPSVALDVSTIGATVQRLKSTGSPTAFLSINGNGSTTDNQGIQVNSGTMYFVVGGAPQVTLTGSAISATTSDTSFKTMMLASGQGNAQVLSVDPAVSRIIGMTRMSSGSANPLTVTGAGALSGATNANGGTLNIASGASTGSGSSTINFQTSPAGSSGSSDNTVATAMTILGNGNVGIGTTAPASKLHVGVAPTASANYGLLSLGSGAFDGTTTGYFVGNVNGTVEAINTATGYTGDLINYQVAGASKFKVDAAGNVTSAGTFNATSGSGSSNINNSGSGSTVINGGTNTGALTLGNPTGGIALGGSTTLAANQSFTMSSGSGQFNQTYTGTTTSARTLNANSVTTAAAESINANGLTSGSILSLNSSSTAAANGTSGLNVSLSGANATAGITRTGVVSNVTATGSTSTNVGASFSASGGTNNYGLLVPNGYVGIGTTAPSDLLNLQTTGSATNIISQISAAGGSTLYQSSNGGATGTTSLSVGGSAFLNHRVAGSGWTSVSNTNVLSVVAADAYDGTSFLPVTKIQSEVDAVPSTGSVKGRITFQTSSGSSISEKMRITSDGNIGIGTTSPQGKLDVVSAGGSDVARWTGTFGSNRMDQYGSFLMNTGIMFSNYDSSVSSGSLTTYNAPLYITSDGGGGGTNHDIIIKPNGTGNVGIGTMAPTAKLDVAGTASVSASQETAAGYINSGTSYSVPDSSINIRRITLTGNATLTLPTFNTPTGKVWTFTVIVKQDGTGNRTLAWSVPAGDSILWDQSASAPLPSPTASTSTIYQFTKPSDEATWYASMVWRQN